MAGATAALPWLGALALACIALVVACSWPLRFDLSARARGEADGRWFVAGGASLAVLSVTFVWARGIPAQLTLLLFGRKLDWQPTWSAKPAERVRPAPRGRLWRRLDPLGLALKILEERRHVRLRYLVLDLAYGFRDPLLTGRLVGALAMLSAVLPDRVELRQRPRWDFEDGWEIAVDGRAVVRPWLMLLDLAAYVVRQLASRRAPEAGPRPARI
jgi:hypothetical protein